MPHCRVRRPVQVSPVQQAQRHQSEHHQPKPSGHGGAKYYARPSGYGFHSFPRADIGHRRQFVPTLLVKLPFIKHVHGDACSCLQIMQLPTPCGVHAGKPNAFSYQASAFSTFMKPPARTVGALGTCSASQICQLSFPPFISLHTKRL